MTRSQRTSTSSFLRTRLSILLSLALAGASTAWLVSGCSTILGADFDRPAASADGGAAVPMDIVTNVPEPEPPNPDGSCAEGRKLCGGSCVSRLDARFGCGGATCDACALPNAVAACTSGALCAVSSCKAGWTDCDGKPTDGCETELASDPAHCGSCERACNAGLVCGNGTCTSTCPEGTRPCGGGACKAESPTSCGAACLSCTAPAHGVPVCTNGGCDFTCDKDYERQGATCVDTIPHDTWATVASMPTERRGLAAAAGADGRIYAIGGSNDAYPVSTVEVYTPSTNTWTEVASLLTARYDLAAAAGADGRIYAIGGWSKSSSLSTVEVYTPSTNTWTEVASMPTARDGLAAATGADGRIYAVGGWAGGEGLGAVEVYTPSTNTWTEMASLPTARTGLAVAPGPGGSIHAIGGLVDFGVMSRLSTVEVYTPSTNTWTKVKNMPTARYNLAAAMGADGRTYAMGGNDGTSHRSIAEAYTPSTNTWTKVTNMPTARSSLAAAAGADGRIYAIGGQNGSSAVLSTVQVYTP